MERWWELPASKVVGGQGTPQKRDEVGGTWPDSAPVWSVYGLLVKQWFAGERWTT